MKRTVLLLATAAMALTSTLASAQGYGGRDGRNDNNRRYEQRNDNRGGQNWQRGQRLGNQYRSRDRQVSDYRRYNLRSPPRGYSYYRQDNGDILLAAIATGLIASIIAGSSDNGYGGAYGGTSYGVGGGYAGAQVFHDSYGRAYTVDRNGRSVWIR